MRLLKQKYNGILVLAVIFSLIQIQQVIHVGCHQFDSESDLGLLSLFNDDKLTNRPKLEVQPQALKGLITDVKPIKELNVDEGASTQNRIEATRRPDTKRQSSIQRRIIEMWDGVMAPVTKYKSLINRYHRWFHEYSKRQKMVNKHGNNKFRDPFEVLKREYVRAEEQLAQESCTNNDLTKGSENDDIVYEILNRVIENLEDRQNIPHTLNTSDYDISNDIEDGITDEQVQRSMEKVKRNVINSAVSLAQKEFTTIAKIVAMNSMATYATNHFGADHPLSMLVPIIQLLGTANTPILTSYLRDIEFRAALAFVDKMNPLNLFCKKEDKVQPRNERMTTVSTMGLRAALD